MDEARNLMQSSKPSDCWIVAGAIICSTSGGTGVQYLRVLYARLHAAGSMAPLSRSESKAN